MVVKVDENEMKNVKPQTERRAPCVRTMMGDDDY